MARLKNLPKMVAKRLDKREHRKTGMAPYSGPPRIFRTAPAQEHYELLHPLLADDASYEFDVSIIFGTYNRLRMLQDSVQSIRHACTGMRYEIVICDGGSTDGTQQWLQEQTDIVYIAGDLSGAVRAFNQCFERVRGRFTIALNDDAKVFPSTFQQGLRYFSDPLVGQVAFHYHENGKWQVQTTHGHLYANYAITRTHIARAIAEISGGYWATCYMTYGGDTELSSWIYRLGYKVAEAPDACVDHAEAMDELRTKNIKTDTARQQYWHRWPNDQHMRYRGPTPRVSPEEAARLHRYEQGELPEQRWHRIAALDPKRGELPAAVEPRSERVLHYHLWTEEDPQNGLANAMSQLGNIAHGRIDWPTLAPAQRATEFLGMASELHPTVVFLQLQGPDALDLGAIARVRRENRDPSLVVIAWSGDVGPTNGPWPGFSDAWAYELAKHVDLMLFTGTGQVQMHRERGMQNAAYLQIGFDEDRYHPGPATHYGSQHDVVFLGQDYGSNFDRIPGQESQLRRDLVHAFERSSLRFAAYGSGWSSNTSAHQTTAGDVYRSSQMALSVSLVSGLGRYSSDRLIRAMACGTPTLVKAFDDMEGWGLRDGVNVIAWNNADEAVEKARHWLDPSRRDALLAIGAAGAELMKTRHTWSYRLKELAALIQAVRGQR